jgi:hypothetical protein
VNLFVSLLHCRFPGIKAINQAGKSYHLAVLFWADLCYKQSWFKQGTLMKQGNYRPELMAICAMAGSILIASFSAMATEVHTWTDDSGVIHFSDSPRASGDSKTIEVEDIYSPGTTDAYAAPEPASRAGGSTAGAESPHSMAQERRDNLATERKERREAQAETERLCALHEDRLARVEPARRVMMTDENGEMVRLDDDQRMALVEESRDFIQKNCR